MLGSGPSVVASQNWSRASFDRIVSINNAWRVRPDWDDAIYPEDFPQAKRPTPEAGQRCIEAQDFVPAQNAYGGFLLGGATMAFTATYWALHALRPSVIAYFGCDMVYSGAQTHFYGKGTADPLRADPSLRSIEAKATRALVLAAQQGCALVNLSNAPSRLTFPKARLNELETQHPLSFDPTAVEAVLAQENASNFATPTGFYKSPVTPSLLAKLDTINASWRGFETSTENALAS